MNDDELDSLGDEEDEGGREWLITYADMVTLLLAFFVLLFSLSSLDKAQFTDSFQAIKQALGGTSTSLATAPISAKDASVLVDQVQLRRQMLMEQQRVFSEVKYLQSTKGVAGLLTANLDKGKIVLRLPSEVLFASGSAELTPQGKEAVAQLKNFFIKHADQIINIKGYTDDVAPHGRYNDNWELSSMRAVNVLRHLMSLGLSPERMTATGLADLEPLYPNTTPENRAKNRRVEFVLEKSVG